MGGTNYYREFTIEEYREKCAKLDKKNKSLRTKNKRLKEVLELIYSRCKDCDKFRQLRKVVKQVL